MNEPKDHDFIEPKDLPSNSKLTREKMTPPEPPVAHAKLEKVVTGKVIKKNRSLLDRAAETFFGDDAKGVGRYVVFDVLIPAAKDTFSQMVKSAVDMILFGEVKGSRTSRDRGRSYVSYQSYYGRGREDDDRVPLRNRARHRFDDIILETRGEGEEVLSSLVDVIDDYGAVTVGEFYDLVGIASDHTDNKYGWTNLSRATVEGNVRSGFYLNMPPTKELD